MRALTRGDAPECLGHTPKNAKWGDFDPKCKKEVLDELRSMAVGTEGPFCHYCESLLKQGQNRYSIDHMYPRHRYPARTFDWSNLYLSCKTAAHCDQFKDAKGCPPYEPEDLLRPDVDEPDSFLQFLSSGEVIPREGLTPSDQHRAETTIRVLALNATDLQARRQQTALIAKSYVDEVLEIEGWEESELQELLAGMIAEAEREMAGLAYSSVARHYFMYFQ